MATFDYKSPQFHLSTRGTVSSGLVDGLFPISRSSWDNYAHFQGWPMHVLRLHAVISDACVQLTTGLEDILSEPEGSTQELLGLSGMNRLGRDLVQHVHHHHTYEDVNVLPGFVARFPQLETAIDLLEHDHVFLHNALDESALVFAKLQGGEVTKLQIDKALEQARELGRILVRHTDDEEDILIPAVLDAYS